MSAHMSGKRNIHPSKPRFNALVFDSLKRRLHSYICEPEDSIYLLHILNSWSLISQAMCKVMPSVSGFDLFAQIGLFKERASAF